MRENKIQPPKNDKSPKIDATKAFRMNILEDVNKEMVKLSKDEEYQNIKDLYLLKIRNEKSHLMK